jgi:tetratricopeptide (TPR) repeat protein
MTLIRHAMITGILVLCLGLSPGFALAQDDSAIMADFALQTLQHARELHERGKLEEAIEHYDKALGTQLLRAENRAIAFNNRGNAYADLGLFEDAVADYCESIDISPAFIESYFNRGIARYQLGEYMGSIDDFTMVIKLNPGNASAYYNRSFPYEGMQDYLQAIKDAGRAVMMQPQRKDYKLRLENLQKLARQAGKG